MGIQKIFDAMHESNQFVMLQIEENYIYAEKPGGARYEVKVSSHGFYQILIEGGWVFSSSSYEDLIDFIKA